MNNNVQGYGYGPGNREWGLDGGGDMPPVFLMPPMMPRWRYNLSDGEIDRSSVGSYQPNRLSPVQFTTPGRLGDQHLMTEDGVVIPMARIVSTHSIGVRPQMIDSTRVINVVTLSGGVPVTNPDGSFVTQPESAIDPAGAALGSQAIISSGLTSPESRDALVRAIYDTYAASVIGSERDMVNNPSNFVMEHQERLKSLWLNARSFVRMTNLNLRNLSFEQMKTTPHPTESSGTMYDYMNQEVRKVIDYVATHIFGLAHRTTITNSTTDATLISANIDPNYVYHPNSQGGANQTPPLSPLNDQRQAGIYLFQEKNNLTDLYFWPKQNILRDKDYYFQRAAYDASDGANVLVYSLYTLFVSRSYPNNAADMNPNIRMSFDINGATAAAGARMNTVADLVVRPNNIGGTISADILDPYGKQLDDALFDPEYSIENPDYFVMKARSVVDSVYDLLWYIDFKDVARTDTLRIVDYGRLDDAGTPLDFNSFVGKVHSYDKFGISETGTFVLSHGGFLKPITRAWDDQFYGNTRDVAGIMNISTGGIPVQDFYSQADVRVGKLDTDGRPLTGRGEKAPVRGIHKPAGVNFYDVYEDVRGRWMNIGQPTQRGATYIHKGRYKIPYILSPDVLPGSMATTQTADNAKLMPGGVFRLSDNLFAGPIGGVYRTKPVDTSNANLQAFRDAASFPALASLANGVEPISTDEADGYASIFREFTFMVIRDPRLLMENERAIVSDSHGNFRIAGDLVDNYEYKAAWGPSNNAATNVLDDTIRYHTVIRQSMVANSPRNALYAGQHLGMIEQDVNMTIGRITRWEQPPRKLFWDQVATLPGSNVTGTETGGIVQFLYMMAYHVILSSRVINSINEQYLWGSVNSGFGQSPGTVYQDRQNPRVNPTFYPMQNRDVRALITKLVEDRYIGFVEVQVDVPSN